MATLKVVSLNTPNLKDVPDSLRRLADSIESGEGPAANHAIVVLVDVDGEIYTYGYGSVGNTAHEVGVLHMAAIGMAI